MTISRRSLLALSGSTLAALAMPRSAAQTGVEVSVAGESPILYPSAGPATLTLPHPSALAEGTVIQVRNVGPHRLTIVESFQILNPPDVMFMDLVELPSAKAVSMIRTEAGWMEVG